MAAAGAWTVDGHPDGRIDRLRPPGSLTPDDLIDRGRRAATLDVKADGYRATAHELIAAADVVIEGFRPGVRENAAVVDGTSSVLTLHHALTQTGGRPRARCRNLLDGGAPFYVVYETLDGLYVSIGAIQPKFHAILIAGMGLDATSLSGQYGTRGGPNCAIGWPRRSAPKRATAGARCSEAPTSSLRRSRL